MSTGVREGLHKLAISFAHLWYWNVSKNERKFTEFFIYPNQIDVDHYLYGKRIKLRIQIEDDPSLKRSQK